MVSGSTTVVLFALCCNLVAAAAKFAAATLTGSSAMLSGAIHSLIDGSNQALLLHGQRQASRPADPSHQFGHSRELLFWGFVAAILLYALGAGVTIYEGIDKVLRPRPITSTWMNYAALGFAFALTAISTLAAMRAIKVRTASIDSRQGIWQTVRATNDPALYIVVFENCAALAGLAVAVLGVAAADIGGYPEADGLASIAIGLVLAFVAASAALKVKGLLIADAGTAEVQAGIERLLQREIASSGLIRQLHDVRTLQLGNREVVVTARADVTDGAGAGEVDATTRRLETTLQAAFPAVRHLFVRISETDAISIEAAGKRAEATAPVARPSPAASPPPSAKKQKTKKSRR